MRPTRLELNGFASFREPTVLDFTDVELFVLSGPTGAGKSSIIDAMTFSLYGSVPRYDDKRLVAPVISQGQLEARVRLDFTVGGTAYTAVRVVRRTKNGATTKEARLERDGVTLAATADELSNAVRGLLGLSFEHFTRTVVLPQGDFQEFLHAKPGDRQDLLVQLLDLDVYRRVATAARSEESTAKGALEGLRSRLDGELADVTPEALAAAQATARTLESLVADLDEVAPELEEIKERGRAARTAATTAAEQRTALDELRAPAGLEALATELRDAATAVTTAETASAGAHRVLDERKAERTQRPATAHVQQVLDATRALARAERATADLAPTVEASAASTKAAEQQRADAAAAVDAAQRALDALRTRHAAHALAAGLDAGDPCPVCDRELDQAPQSDAPDDLAAAERELEAARRSLRERETAARAAADAASRATAERDAAERTVREQQGQVERLRSALDVPVDAEALNALVSELTEADRLVAEAERVAADARRALQQAQGVVQALDQRRNDAFQALDRARDGLATLEPPALPRDDLGVAWQQLLAWAETRRPEVDERAVEAQRGIDAATEEWQKRLGEVRVRASDAGVDPGPAPQHVDAFAHLRDACVAARTRAAFRVEQLTTQLATAAEVRDRIATTQRRAELSKALGQHLSAKKFEKWLLNRALQRLVVGASEVLRELSSGAYSLALGDDNNFLVIDHRNADEQRSARTLSGGETFLASLSLALSLADDVAALAAHGSARLEALFLDEGFGTLDADTLDTVASAIEELGSKGRMVGLITHVRDLSERVPVRYEVRKGPGGSSVEKVTT